MAPGRTTGARAYAENTWVIAGDKLRSAGWQPEYSSEQALVVSDERAIGTTCLQVGWFRPP